MFIVALLYGKEKECHNVYDEFVDCADPTGCGLGNDAIAWDYQVWIFKWHFAELLSFLCLKGFCCTASFLLQTLLFSFVAMLRNCDNIIELFISLFCDFQACTEMILPGGSTNVTDMFPAMPFTLEDREAYCSRKYLLGKSRLSWVSTNFWGTG